MAFGQDITFLSSALYIFPLLCWALHSVGTPERVEMAGASRTFSWGIPIGAVVI